MDLDVKVNLDPAFLGLLRKYDRSAIAPMLSEAIRVGMNRGNLAAVPVIQRNRFTHRGPESLGIVTESLRRSISTAPAAVLDAERLRVASVVGSNAQFSTSGREARPIRYFHIHEFGFSGTVGVRGHLRQGRPVRAHARTMSVPERAPLRRGLRDREVQTIYADAIEGAVVEALGIEG